MRNCLHVSLRGPQYQQLPCHILFLMIILKQINAVFRFLRKLIWSSYRKSQNVYCFHLLWCILLCRILLLLSKRYKIQKDFRCVLIKISENPKDLHFCFIFDIRGCLMVNFWDLITPSGLCIIQKVKTWVFGSLTDWKMLNGIRIRDLAKFSVFPFHIRPLIGSNVEKSLPSAVLKWTNVGF